MPSQPVSALQSAIAANGGGWFCEHCETSPQISEDVESPARCPRCKRATAVWIFPAATQARTTSRPSKGQVPAKPATPKPVAVGVSLERGHSLFRELQQKLNPH